MVTSSGVLNALKRSRWHCPFGHKASVSAIIPLREKGYPHLECGVCGIYFPARDIDTLCYCASYSQNIDSFTKTFNVFIKRQQSSWSGLLEIAEESAP